MNKGDISLKFNCKGNDPLEEKNIFLNKYPVSLSCRFVIGVVA